MRHDVLIDGVEADGGWLEERAFQFGDGLFETIAIIDGKPCLWDAHMARLADGCDRLRLPQPDLNQITEESRRLCAGRQRAVLKLYWTAGPSERGYRRPTALNPRRICVARSGRKRPGGGACANAGTAWLRSPHSPGLNISTGSTRSSHAPNGRTRDR